MKVWITKYALSQGMYVVENAVACSKGMIKQPHSGPGTYDLLHHGNDWHTSEASAKSRVRQMIETKRKSIAKTLAKLDKLESQMEAK